MHAIVVGGGDMVPSPRVLDVAATADLIIAADSGARHLPVLGRTAAVYLGDFDSTNPPLESGADVIRFPAEKDQTDLHLAIREARRRGAARVTMLAAARGERLDHGAANLLLLTAREFRGFDLRLVDGDDECRIVREALDLAGSAGDLVTLLSISRVTTGITTEGLAYALKNASLRRGDTRGVSNVMVSSQARVSVTRGVLLAVHRAGGDPNALR